MHEKLIFKFQQSEMKFKKRSNREYNKFVWIWIDQSLRIFSKFFSLNYIDKEIGIILQKVKF